MLTIGGAVLVVIASAWLTIGSIIARHSVVKRLGRRPPLEAEWNRRNPPLRYVTIRYPTPAAREGARRDLEALTDDELEAELKRVGGFIGAAHADTTLDVVDMVTRADLRTQLGPGMLSAVGALVTVVGACLLAAAG